MFIEIQQVDQVFRTGFWLKPVQILHAVSFEIPKGSIFGFLGPNGAGKTTLIQLMVGIRRPTRGKITLDGKNAFSKEARSKLGYLPERPYFHEHLTGEQVLHFFGALSGLSPSEVNQKIPELLELVDISSARKIELRKYSKGMLQRIGIAQALIHDPDILILDEPMSGLDPIGRKEIRDLICLLAQKGKTIFFSSHVISDVEAICDRLALIHHGKLVVSGLIQDFLSKGIQGTEIGISGLNAEKLRCLGPVKALEILPQAIRLEVSRPEDTQQVIRCVIENGGKIEWVTPQRPSLEDWLVNEVKA